DDMDQKIMDWLIQEFRAETSIDVSKDKMVLQRLKEASEKAKIELSSTMETEINLPFLTADQTGPKHLVKRLSRAKFEQMCEDLFQRALEPTKKCLADAKKNPKEIDEVILVGGATRVPKLQQIVKDFFGKEPNRSVNPDEVVAIGAAVQGGVLTGEVKDILLLDVTPLTLSIETLGGVATPLIPRNTTIPTKKSEVFSTAGLSKDDIDKAVKEAQSHEAEDKQRREEIEVRNRADNLAYATEKSLKDLGDKIPADTKADLESKVKAVRDALAGSDVEAVKN